MRKLLVVVGLLVVAAVVGTLVARCSDETATTTNAARSGASRQADAAPVTEPAHGEVDSDPVAAAVTAVGLTDEVVAAGFISRRELIESFATAEFGPRLADETSEQVTSLLLELGGAGLDPSELRVLELPISARVVDGGGGRASVEVWSVMVVALPEAGAGRQVWRTVSLDMVLVDGRWLVDGWVSSFGPAPAGAPEGPIGSGAEIADVLDWGPALPGGAG